MAALAWAVAHAEPAVKVLHHDALDTERNIRRSVEESFPDLKFGCYHRSGGVLVGTLEDFEHHRILLLLPGNQGFSKGAFLRNGEAWDPRLAQPVMLKHYGGVVGVDGTTVDITDKVFEGRIGYWIPLEATDRFSMTATAEVNSHGWTELAIRYDPDAGWQSSFINKLDKERAPPPADVYEVSRAALVPQVVGTLARQEECLFRFKDSFGITLRKWTKADEEKAPPLLIRLTDKIRIGADATAREITKTELRKSLETYCAAALSAQVRTRVIVHVGMATSDELFREVLRGMSREGLIVGFVEIEE